MHSLSGRNSQIFYSSKFCNLYMKSTFSYIFNKVFYAVEILSDIELRSYVGVSDFAPLFFSL